MTRIQELIESVRTRLDGNPVAGEDRLYATFASVGLDARPYESADGEWGYAFKAAEGQRAVIEGAVYEVIEKLGGPPLLKFFKLSAVGGFDYRDGELVITARSS